MEGEGGMPWRGFGVPCKGGVSCRGPEAAVLSSCTGGRRRPWGLPCARPTGQVRGLWGSEAEGFLPEAAKSSLLWGSPSPFRMPLRRREGGFIVREEPRADPHERPCPPALWLVAPGGRGARAPRSGCWEPHIHRPGGGRVSSPLRKGTCCLEGPTPQGFSFSGAGAQPSPEASGPHSSVLPGELGGIGPGGHGGAQCLQAGCVAPRLSSPVGLVPESLRPPA